MSVANSDSSSNVSRRGSFAIFWYRRPVCLEKVVFHFLDLGTMEDNKEEPKPRKVLYLGPVGKITHLAVVGSRSFHKKIYFNQKMREVLLTFPHVTTLVSGGTRGPDSMAETYAKKNGLKMKVLLPNWDTYGRSAGIKRNTEIVEKCQVLVAFWDGKSPGTSDSIRKAQKQGKPAFIYRGGSKKEGLKERV